MGDRRLRLPHDVAHRRPPLPQPSRRAGGIHPSRRGRGGGFRQRCLAGGEGRAGARDAAGAAPRHHLRRRPPCGGRCHAGRAGGARRHGGHRRATCHLPRAGPRREAGRSRDADLHVGDDGRAQRGDALARQPVFERHGLGDGDSVRVGGRRGAQLPAAVAHLRTNGRPLPDVPRRLLHRVRRVDRHRADRPADGQADARAVRATPLREDVRPRAGERAGRRRGQAADLLLGAARGRALGRRAAGRSGTQGSAGAAIPHRAEARVLEAQGAHRRTASLLRVGGRAARAGDQQVLLCRRARDPRGLRPDRDLAGHRGEHAGGVPHRHGRPADQGSGGDDRPRRGDPHAWAARHEGLLQQAGRDAGGHRRRRLVPHRRHR